MSTPRIKVYPKPSDEAYEFATSRNLFPIQLNCENPNAGPNEYGGICCTAFVEQIPRVGETIQVQSQNGTEYHVDRVVHVLGNPEFEGIKDIMATYVNVFATRLRK